MAPAEQLRLLIIADVRLYREGIRDSLSNRAQFKVVGAESTIDGALRRIAESEPNIVIIDIATRGSLAGVRRIREAAPGVQIVGFGVDEEEHEILACAEAGVTGYVPCDASLDDLVARIHSVSRGELVCTPKMAATLFRCLEVRHLDGPPQRTDLTSREREVLKLINGGLSNKEIAVRLHIEVSTVKNHVHNVLDKLHVTSRAQAAQLTPRVPARGRSVTATPAQD